MMNNAVQIFHLMFDLGGHLKQAINTYPSMALLVDWLQLFLSPHADDTHRTNSQWSIDGYVTGVVRQDRMALRLLRLLF